MLGGEDEIGVGGGISGTKQWGCQCRMYGGDKGGGGGGRVLVDSNGWKNGGMVMVVMVCLSWW